MDRAMTDTFEQNMQELYDLADAVVNCLSGLSPEDRATYVRAQLGDEQTSTRKPIHCLRCGSFCASSRECKRCGLKRLDDGGFWG